MNEPGKSDSRVVPEKVSNKAWRRAAERLEGRRLAERNSSQATTLRTQSRALLARAERVVATWGGYGKQQGEGQPACRHYARQEPGAVVPHAGICGGGGQQ